MKRRNVRNAILSLMGFLLMPSCFIWSVCADTINVTEDSYIEISQPDGNAGGDQRLIVSNATLFGTEEDKHTSKRL